MTSFSNPSVESAFQSLPHNHQATALQLRKWIHEVADELSATGGIDESLKWGQPAYLPIKPRVGSTIRVWRHDGQHVALYFNQCCLVDTPAFRPGRKRGACGAMPSMLKLAVQWAASKAPYRVE